MTEGLHSDKRATTSDVANIGYATFNGGYRVIFLRPQLLNALTLSHEFLLFSTTGGKGGSVVTVTTLAALTTAVTGDTAAIVIISGTSTGNTVVKVYIPF